MKPLVCSLLALVSSAPTEAPYREVGSSITGASEVRGAAAKSSPLAFESSDAANEEWPGRAETPIADVFPYDHVMAMTHESRKNLGVERIDLQQLHVWSDAWVADEGW